MWALCVILALGGQVQGIWKTRNIIYVQVGVALDSSGDKETANRKSEYAPHSRFSVYEWSESGAWWLIEKLIGLDGMLANFFGSVVIVSNFPSLYCTLGSCLCTWLIHTHNIYMWNRKWILDERYMAKCCQAKVHLQTNLSHRRMCHDSQLWHHVIPKAIICYW